MRIPSLVCLAGSLLATTATAHPSSSPLDFKHTEAVVKAGSHTYHYLRTEPAPGTAYAGTVLLIHGFPDSPYGWRRQIPFLSGLGYRVVVPSALGYHPSSAPRDLGEYGLAAMAADMAELVAKVVPEERQVILGTHDWGAMLGWVLAYRHPEVVKAIVGMAVPHFGPPAAEYTDLADQIAAGQNLNFGYQLQLREPDFPKKIAGPKAVRQVLRAIFEGTTPSGQHAVTARHGLNFTLLPSVQPAPFLPAQLEALEVKRLTAVDGTLRAPLNWYRTSRLNWEDATAWKQAGGSFAINQTTLFLCGLRDPYVPCELSEYMAPFFADLTRIKVNTTHWIQTEGAAEVNAHIGDFLAKLE